MKRTILYLDDEVACLDLFRHMFGKDHDVRTATKSSEARSLLAMRPAEIIISDHIMPDIQGTEFLREVALQFPESYRVLLTGAMAVGSFISEISTGSIHHFLAKPWSVLEMQQMFERAARRRDSSPAKFSSPLSDRDSDA